MIDPSTGWFKIVKVPYFDLEEESREDNEYIENILQG